MEGAASQVTLTTLLSLPSRCIRWGDVHAACQHFEYAWFIDGYHECPP